MRRCRSIIFAASFAILGAGACYAREWTSKEGGYKVTSPDAWIKVHQRGAYLQLSNAPGGIGPQGLLSRGTALLTVGVQEKAESWLEHLGEGDVDIVQTRGTDGLLKELEYTEKSDHPRALSYHYRLVFKKVGDNHCYVFLKFAEGDPGSPAYCRVQNQVADSLRPASFSSPQRGETRMPGATPRGSATSGIR